MAPFPLPWAIGVGVLSMVCGLVKFDVNNLMPVYENIGTSAHNSMFGGMFAILATSPFFLCGFENIPQAVEDAGGSHKKVGFTVLLSIIMACLFYALLLFCIGAAWPWQDFYLNTASPAAANVFAKIFAGSAMGNVMYILLCAGALCGLPMAWFAALSMVAILIMMFIPGTPAYIGGMAVKMFLAWCVVGVAMFLATAPSRNQKSPEERYNNLFANAAQQHQKDLMMD